MWMSLIAPDFRAVCADLAIPVYDGPTPGITFHGDTLVMIQTSIDAQERSRADLRRFVADTTGCDWIPVSTTEP